MHLKLIVYFYSFITFVCFAKCQGVYNYIDEQVDTTKFFVGIDLGAHFANHESAEPDPMDVQNRMLFPFDSLM